jgi:hypothetical protein
MNLILFALDDCFSCFGHTCDLPTVAARSLPIRLDGKIRVANGMRGL